MMPRIDFDKDTTRFSLLNALRLAEAAQWSYQPWKDSKKFLQDQWGFTRNQFFENNETEAFAGADEELIILAFRGSQTPEDWQADYDVKLVPYSHGRVHRGFNQAIDYVWKDIEQFLRPLVDEGRGIWVTGHSLGGALATLAVDRLTEEDMDVRGLYTFGQPRVGDKEFAEHFNEKIKFRSFRFVNDEDIVTRVPPRVMGYEHIGTVRFFDSQGNLFKDNIFWKWWLSHSESVAVRSLDRFQELKSQYPDGLQDHSLTRYIDKIQKNLLKERGIKNYQDYLKSI